MSKYIPRPDCDENGIRWMRAYASGDRWSYRALDAAGNVLAAGELGDAEEVTDSFMRFRVDIPAYHGEIVRMLCDSTMLGESIEHVLSRPTGCEGYSSIRLLVTTWLTDEEIPNPPGFYPLAETTSNCIVPYTEGRTS